ncbi:hypothetical protein LTR97_009001 [Elasticomyces elasticus]|uniref:Uncharacterized protein n=1 Tax=Elasticomyces elasticus TaxID=574655 RepID=A0AAN8A024_9PEZI|nr:hypothetical protein LTR97_009001 [Elasticomyces elasticus]
MSISDGSSTPPFMDPPAYTATPTNGSSTLHTPAAPARRNVLEMRALILGNAAILKPRKRDDEIQLIVARHKSPQHSAEEVPLVQHYAFLVQRKYNETDINIVLKGEPRDTIEEALEWMLERTETVMEEMLLRHGTHVSGGCCLDCGRSLNPRQRPLASVAERIRIEREGT